MRRRFSKKHRRGQRGACGKARAFEPSVKVQTITGTVTTFRPNKVDPTRHVKKGRKADRAITIVKILVKI